MKNVAVLNGSQHPGLKSEWNIMFSSLHSYVFDSEIVKDLTLSVIIVSVILNAITVIVW